MKYNDQAFPECGYQKEEDTTPFPVGGLTKLELLSGMMMQSMVGWYAKNDTQKIVKEAIKFADALLSELENHNTKNKRDSRYNP